LAHLKHLPHLGEVELYGTRVTEAGIRELHKALPTLRIGR
jgi:hypothetical protein